MSADGAMVPLTGGEWAEVRTLAIGEVPAGSVYPERVHVGELSYFSRLTDAASFTDLAEVETRRRQLVHAKEVCAMMDGADGLQPFVEMHRSDAVRILDFPHAAEHLSKLLEALSARGHPFPAGMLERGVPVLKHPGPAALTRMAARLSEQETSQEDVREHLGYLRKRLALMNYPLFQRAGWPIGSGMGESANKLVVEARLKGCGMRWERPNVKPLLALRNGVWNERWQETWYAACQQRRMVRAQHRHDRLSNGNKPGERLSSRIPLLLPPLCFPLRLFCLQSSRPGLLALHALLPIIPRSVVRLVPPASLQKSASHPVSDSISTPRTIYAKLRTYRQRSESKKYAERSS